MDTETGQRGYLLTRDLNYLEPYHQGISHTNKYFKQISRLTIDNKPQQEKLKIISKLMAHKFSELSKTINLTKNGDNSSALNIVKQNTGKQYMDDIRLVLSDFVSKENILLEKRKGDFRDHRTQLTTLITIEILFFIGLCFMTFGFLYRNIFTPLKFLISSTEKVERGNKIEISDILPSDEMGYLLSRFYKMNEVLYDRTKILKHEAEHDSLTNLKNRSQLNELLENSLKESNQLKSKVIVLFLDLNKFKILNDSLGHEAGDLMLKETAHRLVSSTRKNDLVFRIGGDEFIVLIRDVFSKEQTLHVVNNLLNSFNEPMKINAQDISIGISIGVAVAPDNGTSAEKLIKMADVAMYAAKKEGVNNFKFFNEEMYQRENDLESSNEKIITFK